MNPVFSARDFSPREKLIITFTVLVLLVMSTLAVEVRAVSDDLHLMEMTLDHPLVRTLDPTDDVFPYDRRLYRPLTQDLYFRLLYPLFELQSLPYHLINLALMFANGFLVYYLAVRLFNNREAGLWGAFFYVLSPLNRMPFTRICYIQDVLMVFLALLALAAFLRGRDATGSRGRHPLVWSFAGAGLYLLSLLSKESSVLLPAILWAIDFFADHRGEPIPAMVRRRLGQHLPFDLAFVLYMAFRLVFIPPSEDGAYGMALGANIAFRLDEYLSDVAASVLPFFPMRTGLSPYFLAAAGTAAVIGWGWNRPKIPAMVWAGFAWFGLGLLVFLPLTQKSVPYFISFAAIGFFWAAGAGVAGILARGREYALPAAAVFIFLLTAANLHTNYREFVEHDLIISRETRDLHLGLKALHPDFPDNARIVLLLNNPPDFPPSSFGVRLLYRRPDLKVMFPDEVFNVIKGEQFRYLSRPGVDYSNAFIFGISQYGFCEFELMDGQLAIKECLN